MKIEILNPNQILVFQDEKGIVDKVLRRYFDAHNMGKSKDIPPIPVVENKPEVLYDEGNILHTPGQQWKQILARGESKKTYEMFGISSIDDYKEAISRKY